MGKKLYLLIRVSKYLNMKNFSYEITYAAIINSIYSVGTFCIIKRITFIYTVFEQKHIFNHEMCFRILHTKFNFHLLNNLTKRQ